MNQHMWEALDQRTTKGSAVRALAPLLEGMTPEDLCALLLVTRDFLNWEHGDSWQLSRATEAAKPRPRGSKSPWMKKVEGIDYGYGHTNARAIKGDFCKPDEVPVGALALVGGGALGPDKVLVKRVGRAGTDAINGSTVPGRWQMMARTTDAIDEKKLVNRNRVFRGKPIAPIILGIQENMGVS